jgi:hypothetical protein
MLNVVMLNVIMLNVVPPLDERYRCSKQSPPPLFNDKKLIKLFAAN